MPFKTTNRLATAQGSTLTIKQLGRLIVQTVEQNKLMGKPFKQTFHITDIKQNIIGIPFLINYIPTSNILNSRFHL